MPRLTTRLVQQISAEGDQFVWDDVVPGFGVRTRSGQKSYVLQYRVMGGRGSRQRRVTLGRVGALALDDARVLAQEYLRGVRYGQDPAAARQAARQAPRVQDLAERYLTDHADVKKKPRSARMDHLNVRLHILPALGTARVDTLTRADVARLHHGMRATPVAANRVLALLSKMCALAEQWGLRDPGMNPARGIERFREKPTGATSDTSGDHPPGLGAPAGGAGAHREPVKRRAGTPAAPHRGTARGGLRTPVGDDRLAGRACAA